ncbi:hypothetical protein EV702DRAFT_1205157 [Suillus placidus]|uniref:Uncharacterized protein n=1 Tax=Suillus placidus TaxID=48579 RepID=A0A9P7CVV5_9AGAM|nr:hypothetical protein EV702DRAFT_1205157 [Suillus placidus]
MRVGVGIGLVVILIFNQQLPLPSTVRASCDMFLDTSQCGHLLGTESAVRHGRPCQHTGTESAVRHGPVRVDSTDDIEVVRLKNSKDCSVDGAEDPTDDIEVVRLENSEDCSVDGAEDSMDDIEVIYYLAAATLPFFLSGAVFLQAIVVSQLLSEFLALQLREAVHNTGMGGML